MSNTRLTLATLAERLDGQLSSGLNGSESIHAVATLATAGPGHICFYTHPRYRHLLERTGATCVLMRRLDTATVDIPHMVVADPYLAYAQVAQWLNPLPPWPPGRAHTSVIGTDCHIDPSAYIGPQAVIGNGVTIGAHTYIGAGTVVGDKTRIGSHCYLHANVTLYAQIQLGNHVILHSGCVVGADGFGFAHAAEGWVKIPQLGSVRIGDYCDIGAHTTIDRGAIDDTILEKGVILDNHIQIAHNVTIGANTAIAGCTAIAGSTQIGKDCLIAGGVRIVGHLTLVDGVQIDATSLVTKSILEPGIYSSALSAKPARIWKKQLANINRLNKIVSRITQLEKHTKKE